MNELALPPTDNLYKFVAIGGLAFALVALIFLFRDQSRLRAAYIDAQIELQAAGYLEGSGPPADRELRKAYYRREAVKWENSDVLQSEARVLSRATCLSLLTSLVGFGFWWRRVQRHEDALVRLSAEKLQREEREASGGHVSAQPEPLTR